MRKVDRFEVFGTGLQGFMEARFEDLILVFGLPHNDDIDKTNAAWAFAFDNDQVFTIYDYKMTRLPTDLYQWHIGGKSPSVVGDVKEYFYKKRKELYARQDD